MHSGRGDDDDYMYHQVQEAEAQSGGRKMESSHNDQRRPPEVSCERCQHTALVARLRSKLMPLKWHLVEQNNTPGNVTSFELIFFTRFPKHFETIIETPKKIL